MPSDDDKRVIEMDESLPGLRLLLDDEAMRRFFAGEMRVDAVRSRYIRYKPGVNALVGYEITSGDRTVPIYAKTYLETSLDKLQPSRRRPPVDGPLGAGFGTCAKERISWWIFPNDARIQALNVLADPESTSAMLRDHFQFAQPPPADAVVERISHKPERRFVGCVSGKEGPIAVLKLYTRDGYLQGSRSAKYYKSGERLRVGELIASARKGILGFTWLPGEDLRQSLHAKGPGCDRLPDVGAALAELHRQKPRGLHPEPGVPLFVVTSTKNGLREALEDGVVDLVILSRFDFPAPAGRGLWSAEAWFNRYFQVVTNAAQLPPDVPEIQ
jgi:hypothetical protein